MRLVHFLNEISQREQDIENVLDKLKNVNLPPDYEYYDDDEKDPRTFQNPLPHLSGDDPQFAEWFDRGDEIVLDYVSEKGWDLRTGTIRAQNKLGQKTVVPINQLIGSETHLDPKGLERKASAKFSSKLPIIYKIDGNLFLVDGNHRVVQAHLKGQTEIEALVLDVNALEQQFGIEV